MPFKRIQNALDLPWQIDFVVYELIFRIPASAWMSNKIDARWVYFGLNTSKFTANNAEQCALLATDSEKGSNADRVKRSRAHSRCCVSVNCFSFRYTVCCFVSLLLPFGNVCLSPFAIKNPDNKYMFPICWIQSILLVCRYVKVHHWFWFGMVRLGGVWLCAKEREREKAREGESERWRERRRRSVVNFHKFELRRRLHLDECALRSFTCCKREWCKECARFYFFLDQIMARWSHLSRRFTRGDTEKPTESMRRYGVMILGRGEMKSNSHLTSTACAAHCAFLFM